MDKQKLLSDLANGNLKSQIEAKEKILPSTKLSFKNSDVLHLKKDSDFMKMCVELFGLVQGKNLFEHPTDPTLVVAPL